jgi:hypothetical protein
MTRKTPSRQDGQGLLVPTNQEFAFAPNGVVVATVEWRKIGGRLKVYVYAPSAEIAKRLPQLGQPGLGERIHALIKKGTLFPTKELYPRLTGCYRIDDSRRGRGHSYLIWAGRATGRGPMFQSGLVYHFQEEQAHVSPYDLAGAVLALRGSPNALHLTSKAAVDHLKVNPSVDLDNRVLIWDLGAIHRG